MSTSENSSGLAEQIATDARAIVARLATLKADLTVLSNLAQGVAMTVDAALPAPEPPAGTLGASVSLGSAAEAA